MTQRSDCTTVPKNYICLIIQPSNIVFYCVVTGRIYNCTQYDSTCIEISTKWKYIKILSSLYNYRLFYFLLEVFLYFPNFL